MDAILGCVLFILVIREDTFRLNETKKTCEVKPVSEVATRVPIPFMVKNKVTFLAYVRFLFFVQFEWFCNIK